MVFCGTSGILIGALMLERKDIDGLRDPVEAVQRDLAEREPPPGIDRVTEAELDLLDTWFQRPSLLYSMATLSDRTEP